MTAGERFKGWIDGLAESWKDRLRGWMASWLIKGIKEFLELEEPAAIDNVQDMIAKIQANPDTSPELKAILTRLKGGGAWFMIVMAVVMSVQAIIGLVTTLWQPGMKQASYTEERAARTHRLDPIAVITAWRRDKPTYEKYFDDLRDQGWSDERIEALKFFTQFYPAPADLIRWQAREVFEPEMIARYGLDSEFGAIEKEPFYKAGMTDEQILNYWRAHWEHASWMQVVEMLHRGLVTEAEVYDWFRLVEIPPFWRDLLIQTAYTWPTRVDVRRWWDMRTIDETELRRLYSGMGYRGLNLDNYVLWTKVYVAFPDLMARWTKGWITIDVVRRELTDLGMPATRVEEMIQMKIKPEGPERVEEGRALTKTEIYKGVKKELITWGEGIELLQDLGYDYDEADYILAVNVGVLEGSPETYEEFKELTQKYKIAAGREAKPMPEELKQAADEVVRLTGEVKALELSIVEEKRGLIAEEEIPAAVTKRLKGLQVKLHRAESTLSAAKSEYDRLVAEWRHGLP